MHRKLSVLFIEDSENDVILAVHFLTNSGIEIDYTIVETETGLKEQLATSQFDIIISDLNLPTFSGLEALRIAKKITPETPFIVVSGSTEVKDQQEVIDSGALDFLAKDDFESLISLIRRINI